MLYQPSSLSSLIESINSPELRLVRLKQAEEISKNINEEIDLLVEKIKTNSFDSAYEQLLVIENLRSILTPIINDIRNYVQEIIDATKILLEYFTNIKNLDYVAKIIEIQTRLMEIIESLVSCSKILENITRYYKLTNEDNLDREKNMKKINNPTISNILLIIKQSLENTFKDQKIKKEVESIWKELNEIKQILAY
ncbi:MAG TPA: hypothetical protein VJI68_00930 [Candidatus Nanoarchaeia archaeon]|nr:hypothetical protein [Candidatus Nanoarchaeia archaeon]